MAICVASWNGESPFYDMISLSLAIPCGIKYYKKPLVFDIIVKTRVQGPQVLKIFLKP